MDDTQAATENADSKKKILLVEDDDALATTYLTRLEAEGFSIRRCNNGEDALATALDYRPDLVLLDVMMPKVSGFEVLDILRNTPETANLKVIVLTALGQEGDKRRASQLGADDYLTKPFSPREFLARVRGDLPDRRGRPGPRVEHLVGRLHPPGGRAHHDPR